MIQSILFNKKRWTIKSAIKWLDSHNYVHPKIHETDNYYRFRQLEPHSNSKFRNINIGNGIEFIIMT